MYMKIDRRFWAKVCAATWALSLLTAGGVGLTESASADETTQTVEYQTIEVEYKNKDLNAEWDEADCYSIVLNGDAVQCPDGVTYVDGRITITQPGDYLISGTLNDGCIYIEAGDADDVRLILNGASLSASDGQAIWCESADKLIVTLAEGTQNALSDGATYSEQTDDEPNAALYARSDLSINGAGALNVTGNYLHGILSKDDLKIVDGAITVNAAGDALRGRDGVAICGGTLDLTAGDDGIQSNYESDPERGWVVIEGGDITIDAQGDGIVAESIVQIEGGTLNITTGGGAATTGELATTDAAPDSADAGRMARMTAPAGDAGAGADAELPPDMPGDMPGGEPPEGLELPDDFDPSTAGDRFGGGRGGMGDANMGGGMNGRRGGDMGGFESAQSYDGESAKAVKSTGAVWVSGGTLTLDSADDALHSNGDVLVSGGTIAISTGDDALHADATLDISGGDIAISQSYEGLEGVTINISGGDISIVASDDGINAAGGNDESGMAGMWGRDQFAAGEQELNITGGAIAIDAGGDGIDSNGDIYMSSGSVYVTGPANLGNGALDYNGVFEISGGVLVAAGPSGMAQSVSDSSSQAAVYVQYSSSQPAGTRLTLTDAQGNVVATYAPGRQYDSVVISAPGIEVGGTYRLYTGGELAGDALTGGEQLCGLSVSGTLTSISSDGSEYAGRSFGRGMR